MLELVDEKKITISMAVDMSYFNEEVQGWLLDYYKTNGKITMKQMATLKELQNLSNITKYTFTATLNGALPEGKGNGRVNLSERKLNKYFPARMTAKERERIIIELLEIIILSLNLVAWMYAKISGLVFFVMGIGVFVAIYEQWWRSLGILAGIAGVGVILFLGSAFVSGELIYYRDRLLGR